MTDAIQDGQTQILFEVVCLYGLCHQLQARLLLAEGATEADVTTSRVVEAWACERKGDSDSALNTVRLALNKFTSTVLRNGRAPLRGPQ
jgi:hypothetical protein